MNRQEYCEFHKYLAILIYEYNKMHRNPYLSEESLSEIGEILEALNKVMKICIVDECDKHNKYFLNDNDINIELVRGEE